MKQQKRFVTFCKLIVACITCYISFTVCLVGMFIENMQIICETDVYRLYAIEIVYAIGAIIFGIIFLSCWEKLFGEDE